MNNQWSTATNNQFDKSSAESLKPFPAVALRLLDACLASDPNTSEIIDLIECDPAIATKVLSVANSPLFGYTREINSIPKAMLVLGVRGLTQYALSCHVSELFDTPANRNATRELLEHSLGTAAVARTVAEKTQRTDPSVAFLTGMLHDIGKLVFINHSYSTYQVHRDELAADSVSTEQELFGVSHDVIGEKFIARMGFPFEVANAVKKHHQIHNQRTMDLCNITSIANTLAKRWTIGSTSLDQSAQRDDSESRPTTSNSLIEKLLDECSSLEKDSRLNFESSRCVFIE